MEYMVAKYCRSLLSAVEAHYKDPSHPYPGDDNAVIYELTPYVESAGIHDPLTKVLNIAGGRPNYFNLENCAGLLRKAVK